MIPHHEPPYRVVSNLLQARSWSCQFSFLSVVLFVMNGRAQGRWLHLGIAFLILLFAVGDKGRGFALVYLGAAVVNCWLLVPLWNVLARWMTRPEYRDERPMLASVSDDEPE